MEIGQNLCLIPHPVTLEILSRQKVQNLVILGSGIWHDIHRSCGSLSNVCEFLGRLGCQGLFAWSK
jgi:hypothetical protein